MKTQKLLMCCYVGFILLVSSCAKETSITIPTASFKATVTGKTVQFTNMSKNAETYLWKFGDGATSTSTEVSPSHTYAVAGSYSVILGATHNDENSTTAIATSQTVTVN